MQELGDSDDLEEETQVGVLEEEPRSSHPGALHNGLLVMPKVR